MRKFELFIWIACIVYNGTTSAWIKWKFQIQIMWTTLYPTFIKSVPVSDSTNDSSIHVCIKKGELIDILLMRELFINLWTNEKCIIIPDFLLQLYMNYTCGYSWYVIRATW